MESRHVGTDTFRPWREQVDLASWSNALSGAFQEGYKGKKHHSRGNVLPPPPSKGIIMSEKEIKTIIPITPRMIQICVRALRKSGRLHSEFYADPFFARQILEETLSSPSKKDNTLIMTLLQIRILGGFGAISVVIAMIDWVSILASHGSLWFLISFIGAPYWGLIAREFFTLKRIY